MSQTGSNPSAAPSGDGFVDRTVCYIDLLGFSNAVILKSKSGVEIQELAALLLEVEELVVGYQNASLTFQTLSDSIFISAKNDSIHNITTLIHCCQDLYRFFLIRGFLVRGGVSSGQCMLSQRIVLGEPVVRAVKLESQVAEFPRIVLGRRTVDVLHGGGVSDFVKKNVVRSDDGPYWIDPFVNFLDLLVQSDTAWKQGSKSQRVSQRRSDFIKQANSISDFLMSNMYELQEDRKSFSYYYWLFKEYRKRLQEVQSHVGSDLKVPTMTV